MELLIHTPHIAGRCLVGLFFLFFGIWNALHWQPTVNVMVEQKIPCANLLLLFGIVWEIIAGTLIIAGFYVQWAALSLIPFNIIAVLIYHQFWKFDGPLRTLNTIIFVTNLTSSLGALLLLAGGNT